MPAWYYIRGILLVVALLAINLPLGEAAAVTSVNTLYYVNPPPVLSQLSLASLEIQSTDRFTLPILSNSYSVLGPGDNGETMYLVEPVRTAELVVGPTTTFTQPASAVTGPICKVMNHQTHQNFPARRLLIAAPPSS
ncbi:hypothetical protein CPC08DRAFT_707190 [Agrocybe pediades]|nr:hypothetical protein CPC08DRAFT_707190 [Agrocybe pediades]